MRVTRKQFLSTAAAPLGNAQRPARKPNVLVLLSDQHRPDLMTCAGRDLVPTPNLDRIASRGTRFTRAYCPYPVCVGSRMSLLTGRYAHQHGAVTNEHVLDWRSPTVARHFREAGYVTGLIGKMHLNSPHLYGFDYHLGFNDWMMQLGPKVQDYANDIASHPHGPRFFETVLDHGSGFPELPYLWEKGSPWAGRVRHNDKVASDLAAEDHIDAFVARESGRFLRQFKDHPFFLIAGFLKPHPPYHPPREWAAKYPAEKMALPATPDFSGKPKHIQRRIRNHQTLGEARLRVARAGYMGNLAFLDVCVGQVYRELESLGLAGNTIVIYTSDHGDMDGDLGLWQKFVLYEASAGVPLIASWPGVIPQGRVSDALVEYLGLWPTLAEMTGTGRAAGAEARSFASLLRDAASRGPEAVFAEFGLAGPTPQHMIRTARYKYIENQGDLAELYDLEADPGERVNREQEAGLRRTRDRLREQLRAWRG
ncbi:MAG: sulfatase family protein [Bryobacteraceae bacterium]